MKTILIAGDSNSIWLNSDEFINISNIGERAADVLLKLKSLGPGDTLIIGVGVNDSATIIDTKSGGIAVPDLEVFEGTYSELLESAKASFERVISIGLVSSTEEQVSIGSAMINYRNSDIFRFNEKIKELCAKFGVDFVDILPCFLGKEKELLVDHIHPNKKGKEIIEAELVRILD